jgi:hypothetical protein
MLTTYLYSKVELLIRFRLHIMVFWVVNHRLNLFPLKVLYPMQIKQSQHETCAGRSITNETAAAQAGIAEPLTHSADNLRGIISGTEVIFR